MIFLAVAFVLLAAFFLFVVSRAAPDPEGVPVEAPAAEPAIRQPGSTGGLAALVLSVGGVGIVGAIAAREVGRRRQPDRR